MTKPTAEDLIMQNIHEDLSLTELSEQLGLTETQQQQLANAVFNRVQIELEHANSKAEEMAIGFDLPQAVVFQLQQIALADDEMVKAPGAAEKYRFIARHILDLFKKQSLSPSTPKESCMSKVKSKRGGDRGWRKPVVDDDGHKWCNCTEPNLIRPIGRGQAFCLRCKTPYYH